ncbi:MAG: hemolysin III family protein [Phycisphaeraceae bacterium]
MSRVASEYPSSLATAVQALRRGPEHDEENWNAATHGLGWVASVVGAVILMRAVLDLGSAWQIVGCAIYCVAMVCTYAASTLSHLYRRPAVRDFFRTADQALIFLFIAGSFTPMALTYLLEGAWWWLTGSMWCIALIGFVSKAVFSHNVHIGNVTTWLYVVVGWLPVLAIWPLYKAMPSGLFVALLAGGACYTLGLIFYHYDHRVRFCHAAWHLAVVAGSVCHYLGILFYCTSGAAA